MHWSGRQAAGRWALDAYKEAKEPDHLAHAHPHGAGGHHGHSHGPANYDRAFLIGIVLNGGFVAVEAVYGVLSNSLALLADAGHNLGDVLSLVLAWGASAL